MVMVRTGGSRCPYGSFRVGADVFPGKAVVLRSHRIHRCLHHVAYMSSQIADSHTHTHTHISATRGALFSLRSQFCCAPCRGALLTTVATVASASRLFVPVHLQRSVVNGSARCVTP